MQEEDLDTVMRIYRECFPEDNSTLEEARDWIRANWRAAPRTFYLVLLNEEEQVGGYILWMEKGGFRQEAVLELEQIGVSASWRGRGAGTLLIKESLGVLKRLLASQGRKLKLVAVTTSSDNEAQRLYQKTLGARVEATISDLYAGNEVIMVARNP